MTALASAAGTLLAASAATGALWFTGQSLHATNTQLGMSQQTAITDRFRLAAEQLSSKEIDVRISGIYLFERLAKDSPADHATVYSVLAAFVRTHAPATNCPTPPEPAATPVDIQTAMTVIGRRDASREQPTDKPDLGQTCLRGADLGGADLGGADLGGAVLGGAVLDDANLGGAVLDGADLTDANLTDANLTDTYLDDANLTHAYLGSANLTHAYLTHANLTHANLAVANLTDADLTHADLTGTQYDLQTRWPKGFTPPPPPR
ncbi:pentapeptide repeat-containing protein [Nocardia sp. GAS34]|uniref:pentapeptide repeat-containing protein n=1 Tax=unclassified Nocardia TaxID=2637762 RepID=UPI003D2104A1